MPLATFLNIQQSRDITEYATQLIFLIVRQDMWVTAAGGGKIMDLSVQ